MLYGDLRLDAVLALTNTRSLSGHLDDQAIATDSKPLALTLVDNGLGLVSRAESHEASSF